MTSPNQPPISLATAPTIPIAVACPALTERLPGHFQVVTLSVIPEHNPRVLMVVPPTPASLPAGKRYR